MSFAILDGAAKKRAASFGHEGFALHVEPMIRSASAWEKLFLSRGPPIMIGIPTGAQNLRVRRA